MNAYALATIDSSIALKRWTHASRFRKALQLLDIQQGERLLDFGCGDGLLLDLLTSSGARLEAYEPHPLNRAMAEARLCRPVHAAFAEIGASFDAVACLEVLEHVPDDLIDRTLAELRQCLSPRGRCVVSVPVEIGPVALAKNIARSLFGASHPGFRWRDAMAVAVYCTGHVRRRRKGNILPGHVGFDHVRLRRRIEGAGFSIARTVYTPFGIGGHLVNSQVFWVLEKGRHHAT